MARPLIPFLIKPMPFVSLIIPFPPASSVGAGPYPPLSLASLVVLLTLVSNVDRDGVGVKVLVFGSKLKLVASVVVPPSDDEAPYEGVKTEDSKSVDESTGQDVAVASVVVPPVMVVREGVLWVEENREKLGRVSVSKDVVLERLDEGVLVMAEVVEKKKELLADAEDELDEISVLEALDEEELLSTETEELLLEDDVALLEDELLGVEDELLLLDDNEDDDDDATSLVLEGNSEVSVSVELQK
ncbi:hypothetical protein EK21DRAFT_118341 [Setomelanomma holmii]|uniref:Uncharacterized protein n=1 Tax=Setomelanomma holmii TaxID=210430 RepID=A0A9P4GXP4_9PLEO|nr:hypothetical protein EK21DRAFT_118341 [Setomelanomma holmii]